MDIIFLTDNLRLNNDIMEYRRGETEEFISIGERNWHILLEEYGWGKMPKKWITKLNKYNDTKYKNSLYGLLDCEPDGNCLFHCISQTLNERDILNGCYYNSDDIRNMISDNICEEQYDMIINYYRIMKDADDFDEDWDPYSIKSIDDFKAKIKSSGHEYWGDYLLLQILIKSLNLNIFVLNSDSYTNNYSIYNTLNDYKPENDSIFLLYENNCHFKLIGHFHKKMTSYFTKNTIPTELKKLFNLD